jgi:indolepyruvate ferredoxin oxidoreductase beta subunit
VSPFNIYMAGVGGQGIGLLSEVMLRAADHAGLAVKGVDTHGLAQRGGSVVSHVRIGDCMHSPLIAAGEAHLTVALEIHEALRAVLEAAADGTVLVYYDTVWQPLAVRLQAASAVDADALAALCARRNIRMVPVADATLPDVRMQNIVVLAEIARQRLVPGVAADHFRSAMADLMAGKMLAANLSCFDQRVER